MTADSLDRLWALRSPRALHHNIEVKVRCSNLQQARRSAIRLGARRVRLLQQVDTYFHVRRGRLKLRETQGRCAALIWYLRPNRKGARESRYRVVPEPRPAALKLALADALGIRAIVRKRRALLLYKNVRIHLDRVENLGDFVELEAVVGRTRDTSAAASRRRVRQVLAALDLDAAGHEARSYGELITGRRQASGVFIGSRRSGAP